MTRTWRSKTVRTLALCTLSAAAACGGGEPVAEDPFGSVPWRLEGPEVRIGAVDDPELSFSSVTTLAVGPDQHMYSLHRTEASVRRWTPDGQPAGTFGREGEGPGEFRSPGNLGFFGDTLWVMDRRGYHVSFFDLQGTFLGRITPEVDIGSTETHPAAPPRPEVPLRDGTFIGRSPAWSQEIATGELTGTPVVHMDAEGSTLTHLWTHEWRTHDVLALINDDGSGGSFMPQPFADETLTSILEDGLLVVDRRAWAGEGVPTVILTRIDLSGDTVFRSRVGYAPVALPAERVDSAVRAQAAAMHGFMSQRNPGLALGDVERDIRAATYAPAYLPGIRGVHVAEDGEVWLRRFEPTTGPDGQAHDEWIVLGPDGSPRARALTPDGLRILRIAGESVFGVESDELDVDYIVRYRIVKDT